MNRRLYFLIEDGARLEEGEKGSRCCEALVAPAPESIASPVLSNI